MTRADVDRNCGQEELETIGRIVVRFSRLDYLLRAWTWGLLGLEPEKGVVATGLLDFKNVLELLDTLYRAQPGIGADAVAQLRKMKERLARINSRRNLLVHAVHVHMSGGGKLFLWDTRPKASLEFTPTALRFGLKDIERLADDIGEASSAVFERVSAAKYPTGLRARRS